METSWSVTANRKLITVFRKMLDNARFNFSSPPEAGVRNRDGRSLMETSASNSITTAVAD